MTGRVSFHDVIVTCKEYGFKVSPYPLILSLENHCSYDQQVMMARIMKEVFGDMLATPITNDDVRFLPSPEDLKYKVLLKGTAIKRAKKAALGSNTDQPVGDDAGAGTGAAGGVDDYDDDDVDDAAAHKGSSGAGTKRGLMSLAKGMKDSIKSIGSQGSPTTKPSKLTTNPKDNNKDEVETASLDNAVDGVIAAVKNVSIVNRPTKVTATTVQQQSLPCINIHAVVMAQEQVEATAAQMDAENLDDEEDDDDDVDENANAEDKAEANKLKEARKIEVKPKLAKALSDMIYLRGAKIKATPDPSVPSPLLLVVTYHTLTHTHSHTRAVV